MRTLDQLGKEKPLDRYTGPGLAVEWVEIEGPLDPWPPAGYRTALRRRAAEAALGRPRGSRGPARAAATRQTAGRLVDLRSARPGSRQAARGRRTADARLPARSPSAGPSARSCSSTTSRWCTTALDKKMSFTEAMLLGYKAALCSPHFLFLTEPLDRSGARDSRTGPGRLRRRLAAVVFPLVVACRTASCCGWRPRAS